VASGPPGPLRLLLELHRRPSHAGHLRRRSHRHRHRSVLIPPTISSSFSNRKSHPKTPLITFTNNLTQSHPIQGRPAASAPRRRGRWRYAGPTSSWPSGASPPPRPSGTPSSPRRRRPSSTSWSSTSRPWPPSAPSRPNSSTAVSPSTSSCMYSVDINCCLLCCQPPSLRINRERPGMSHDS